MTAAEFARKIRNREKCVGYWVVLDAPVATERLARLGYDYVALDGQHGLIGNAGLLSNLMAVDAGGRSVGLVRVESGDPAVIGRALDFGAGGVYVGPSDLCLAVGGRFPNDPEVAGVFEAALERIRVTAEKAGIAAGIHNASGEQAARRLAEGYTFATVSSDLLHLEQAAAAHLRAARGQ
ncbi:hypothetical protein ABGB18_14040 [Nonomuraea sp. B12E4]|uniref:hypothetical protein n=1 Tax=Nonomuraea sp. B12E4 TaxID=3153564 RepID=UPI00325D860A